MTLVDERTEYATAREPDVIALQGAFEAGQALTKDDAKRIYGIPERRMRAAVSALRERGYPVVSYSQEGSTYRKARDGAELEHFIRAELQPRIDRLEDRVRALRARSHIWLMPRSVEQTRMKI